MKVDRIVTNLEEDKQRASTKRDGEALSGSRVGYFGLISDINELESCVHANNYEPLTVEGLSIISKMIQKLINLREAIEKTHEGYPGQLMAYPLVGADAVASAASVNKATDKFKAIRRVTGKGHD